MTSGEEFFYRWAPADSIWAPWAKPVLFTQLAPVAMTSDIPLGPPRWQDIPTGWAPAATQNTALVIDLPGDQPLLMGLALMAKGYQPVVLYNACDGPSPVLDLGQVKRTLVLGAEALPQIRRPPPDAPPAFLIDARRTVGERAPSPGLFDNRWVVLPQDFPSATFLKANGISRVLLLHDRDGQPREDLAHVLLRWQEGGIPIAAMVPGGTAADLRVARPSRFRAAWHSFLVTAGLRPNSAGGFGSVIPVPTQGGFG